MSCTGVADFSGAVIRDPIECVHTERRRIARRNSFPKCGKDLLVSVTRILGRERGEPAVTSVHLSMSPRPGNKPNNSSCSLSTISSACWCASMVRGDHILSEDSQRGVRYPPYYPTTIPRCFRTASRIKTRITSWRVEKPCFLTISSRPSIRAGVKRIRTWLFFMR